MSSTIETLERELGEAQAEREAEQRAVVRAENAHEAACSARDEAWSESPANDPEVEGLTDLVYLRRRELYDAIDRLKAAEGKERRIKSRLMYVLPAERRRYLSGTVDEEFEELLEAVKEAYRRHVAWRAGLRGNREARRGRPAGRRDLAGAGATVLGHRAQVGRDPERWRPAGGGEDGAPDLLLRGGHTPRIFVGPRGSQDRHLPRHNGAQAAASATRARRGGCRSPA